MNNKKFSIAAFALATFIMLVTLLTAVIATPSFLNRIHTTILMWQLPLVTIALIVFAAVAEKEDKLAKIFRLIAVGVLAIGFFLTNITKNTVQDAVSNIENYVDITEATIKSEAENMLEYGRTIERAIDRAEREMYDDEDYDW